MKHELWKVWRGEAVEWDPTQGSEDRLFAVLGKLLQSCLKPSNLLVLFERFIFFYRFYLMLLSCDLIET